MSKITYPVLGGINAALLAVLCGVFLSVSAVAQVLESDTNKTRTTVASTPESETDRIGAKVWGLSETEWHRYRSLLRGIRGSVSPKSLSPIEVLGIHARDASERRHYAELWATAMRDDAERILAFQQAYDTALKRLFGNQSLIDVSRLSRKPAKGPSLAASDRLVFFTRTDCPPCDAVFEKVRPHIEKTDGIDIYFVDADSDRAAIRAWAKQQHIDTRWVRSKRVTLNKDASVLKSIDADAGDPPLLYVRHNGDIRPLPYAEL